MYLPKKGSERPKAFQQAKEEAIMLKNNVRKQKTTSPLLACNVFFSTDDDVDE